MTGAREAPASALKIRCACGWEVAGTEAELIAAAQEHGRAVHNMLPTREEVLAMIIRPEPEPSPE